MVAHAKHILALTRHMYEYQGSGCTRTQTMAGEMCIHIIDELEMWALAQVAAMSFRQFLHGTHRKSQSLIRFLPDDIIRAIAEALLRPTSPFVSVLSMDRKQVLWDDGFMLFSANKERQQEAVRRFARRTVHRSPSICSRFSDSLSNLFGLHRVCLESPRADHK